MIEGADRTSIGTRSNSAELSDEQAQEAAAVIGVVAEEFGLETDPEDERGRKGEWHRAGAVDTLIRVLVQGFSWSASLAAVRAGYSAQKGRNARRPPELDMDETVLYLEAWTRLGRDDGELEPAPTLRVRWCPECGRRGLRGDGAHSRSVTSWSPIEGETVGYGQAADYRTCYGRPVLVEYSAPVIVEEVDEDVDDDDRADEA